MVLGACGLGPETVLGACGLGPETVLGTGGLGPETVLGAWPWHSLGQLQVLGALPLTHHGHGA